MKITFFTARHSISGVPLAQIRLAKLFKEKGYKDIDFIYGYCPENLERPNLEEINLINFDKSRVIYCFIDIVKYFIKNKPDIVISAEDHLNSLVLMAAIITKSKAKISVSSRVTPFDTYSNKLFTKRWFLKHFMNFVEKRADVLVCVSKDMIKQYKTIFKNSRHICIYNVVKDNNSINRMNEMVVEDWLVNKNVPVIISAGRLAPEKGYKDLILAIKEIKKSREVKLLMLGEGELRKDLEELIKQENLTENIKLLGFQSNPLKFYKNSDVFVLSSYLEGLPNVLVEAMMCGCTPVSTNCPTGPAEVLKNGEYGYLVPLKNPKKLAEGIISALENPISKEKLYEGIEDFTEDKVFEQYKKYLEI